jgi:hypothetical protein
MRYTTEQFLEYRLWYAYQSLRNRALDHISLKHWT